MPGQTIKHYHQHAERYQKQYDSVAAHNVHADWISLLAHRTPANALDVGAGSGRDALWLTTLGCQVTAVEPARALRELGLSTTGDCVRWVDASLPHLTDVEPPASGYDLILLSAVWMHLPSSERPLAFHRLSQLLGKTGLLVITLRFGPSDPARPMFPVSTDELKDLANREGLQMQTIRDNKSADLLQRSDVSWQTVCIQHPPEAEA
ncbi:class I SAM-dependent methyltransferase [Marinobacterium mangrovicola]|uniref:Methyltransferase family protein n=1 Tax=Marinobacterium mangrovicola TaxID=1476959 RepID=A0A4R1GJC7_9GAMM|nr:methyltransferase domain-containing protein [Marinobacterium mangrovicola]TCK07270.1 methyltransferase family protein [Marinobacterium mangrovicola]